MITLYTTHCPRCNILAIKLDEAGIQYEINEDVDEMINLGLHSAPALKVDEKVLNFTEAIHWIGEKNAI